MPRLLGNPPFDPGKPVYVRRAFTGGGRHWQIGEEYPWRHLAVSQPQAGRLYEAGRLMHKQDDEPVAVAPEPVLPDTSPVEDDPVTDDLDDIADMTELRRIAKDEGAPLKNSKVLQRKAIRDHRAEAESD